MHTEPPHGSLESEAGALARRHALRPGRADRLPTLELVGALSGWLESQRTRFRRAEGIGAKAAEWVLDNEYLVVRTVRQVGRDMPRGFYTQLPALDAADRRDPRIWGVARGLLTASHLQLSMQTATRYVEAYQSGTPLLVGELWALPTFLRLGCLEVLVAALVRLDPTLQPPFPVDQVPDLGLDDTESVGRAISNLRSIASIPWKDFFCATSHVEAILATDPSGVYPRMDFDTRDRYRRTVELMARWSGRSELEVARRAVERVARPEPATPRHAHVGDVLLDEGRRAFERELGCRRPIRRRVVEWGAARAAPLYAGTIAVALAVTMALPASDLIAHGAPAGMVALALMVSLLPASVLAITFVQWLVTVLVPPRTLPKLDFETGLPPDARTAVVMPTLVGTPADAARQIERLEMHYLANPDSETEFVLLSDFPDAEAARLPADEDVLQALASGIQRLNRRHPGRPFHVLHRPRLHNPSEGVWMGWERKRGKLEDFTRWLRGDRTGRFVLHEGDPDLLDGVRYVVTLDEDTVMPQGTLARLVGTLAHPLNAAEFEAETGRVRTGYTVIQPRIEVSPESGTRTWFARWFTGDTAIDIYTRAVSDVYQDLFRSGIYVGKGAFDVDTFRQSLDGRFPDNALLSHDLIEGVHGRVALASDIVLYESFPQTYLEFTRRLHRWIRGDWQLLPWLLPTVTGSGGRRLRNRLTRLDRWKILDNLRRSLLSPSLVAMLVAGWLVLPGHPAAWTALGVLAPGGHLFTDLVTGFARGRRRRAVSGPWQRLTDPAGRWAMLLLFLPYDAMVAIDAVVRTLVRVLFTRARRLQWTSAAVMSRHFASGHPRRFTWRAMWIAPATACAVLAGILLFRPAALLPAAPLLAMWFVSPEVAFRLGRPRPDREREALTAADHARLRRLARRTWRYFEVFAGPEEEWLPPDNFQAAPKGEIAHRTSPTNIGMMMLSSLAAADLGFLGPPELAARIRNTFETLDQLERYHGHFLNWYDTRTLVPLSPQYVSTVDSGNLAVSLLALKAGCRDMTRWPIVRIAQWDGLADLVGLLSESVAALPLSNEAVGALQDTLADAGRRIAEARTDPRHWRAAWQAIGEDSVGAFEHRLIESLQAAGHAADLAPLRDVRAWLERLHHHLTAGTRQMDTLCPWLSVLASAPPDRAAQAAELAALLPPTVRLADVAGRCRQARALIEERADENGSAPWQAALVESLAAGEREAAGLADTLNRLAARADAMAWSMDFRLLYDAESRLFHIGYNVNADRLDHHHYDLLASEARLASLFAIAKRDVPVEHWFHLGRPITLVNRRRCLVSWGGSMFEYLMPTLLVRSEAGTLLAESERAAVAAHRWYGDSLDLPWGMSESGFGATDAGDTYQYQSFGVPSLGLRRGIAADTVVAPYASVLALRIDPAHVMRNLTRLETLGLLGGYGFFEAADFTPDRVHRPAQPVPVQSYMAHHQGMILAALDNALSGDVLVRRVAEDPRMHAVSLLLHERVPTELAPETVPFESALETGPEVRPAPPVAPWAPRRAGAFPELHLLGNGRFASWISDSGSGTLRWRQWDLTRWVADAATDDCGLWIYLRDDEDGRVWSATRQPCGAAPDAVDVLCHPHLAEFHRRHDDIVVRLETGVAPAEDLEIRALTLINDSARPRRLTVTSYGEVALARHAEHERHPAFSRLFVHSEPVPAINGMAFDRRPLRPEDHPPVLVHWLVTDDPSAQVSGAGSDRLRVVGRGRTVRHPAASLAPPPGVAGFTLDPVMSIAASVSLMPGATVRLAFLTAVGGTRAAAVEVAERYQTMSAVDWVLADARSEAGRELDRLGLDADRLQEFQSIGSLLAWSHRALSDREAAPAANRLGQPQLWGLGISGDLPILLVKQQGPDDLDLVRQLAAAQVLWRRRGLRCDLVVLCRGTSGYEDLTRDRLRILLQALDVRSQLGAAGGVHVLQADHLADDTLRLVTTVAHVVLDTQDGPLADRLAGIHVARSTPPRFLPPPPTIAPEPDLPDLGRPTGLLFDNGIGGFSPDGREYVIHLAPGETTPAPWANVLANEGFGTLVTESGGGFTWSGNSGEHRLTPWTNDPVVDRPVEALYLRDEETAAVWSPTPGPAGADAACQIRHGWGCSSWQTRCHGLTQTLEVFVPPDDPVKIARLRLHNHRRHPRRLTVTSFVDWLLASSRHQTGTLVASEYDPHTHAVLARNPWNPDWAEAVAFVTASRDLHGLTLDRVEFIGREGSLARPAALDRWGLSGALTPSAGSAAAIQVHVELASDADTEVIFVLGEGRDRAHALELAARYRDPSAAEAARRRVTTFWDDRLGVIQVGTPDAAANVMLNGWLLYQTLAARVLARTGFYQSSGAYGFRDQLQDCLAFTVVEPGRLRAHLLECAARQFEDGDVLHWWHPPANRGVRTRCSDDLLWLPFAAAHYVSATGDAAVLDERIPFLEGRPLDEGEDDRYAAFPPGIASGTLFEHCERALVRGVTRGPHGLPRIGSGDWNDGMNRIGLQGRGESVWLGWFAIAAMRRFADLCALRGDEESATRWRARATDLHQSIERHGWDGRWYRRAYDDEGRPWGSSTNHECQVDSIAQSWAVLSGAGDPTRARQALDAVTARLIDDDTRLVRLLTPPFTRGPRDPGYIKAYPPGIRENGGQYTHAAVWVGWALADLGDGSAAYRVFDLLNPIGRTLDAAALERYRVEPFVLAGDIGGVAPHTGRGGWTWYTGSAAWLWRLGIERLVGLRPERHGLRIDPCVPGHWPRLTATVRTPGGVLEIVIENPDGVATGVVDVRVDGRPVPQNLIAFPEDGERHRVVVRLGDDGRPLAPSALQHPATT